MTKKNPISDRDKEIKRIEPELESDKIGQEEARKIVRMVMDDYEAGYYAMGDWLKKKVEDVQHYHSEKPSVIEGLTKKGWQSDRNLGMCPATCDIYQATLLSTCWNPDTLHFVATEKNDVDNKDRVEKFTKWGVSKAESNLFPEVDEFIHNRIVQGFSIFKVYWKVWYEWVDRRIPKKDGGHTIKTEKMRFEKGVVENISDLEDIIMPRYGKRIQDLPWFIHVIHKTSEEVLDCGKRGIFNNIDKKFVESLKAVCVKERGRETRNEKENQMGLAEATEQDLRVFPVDLYEWYGNYTKGNRTEKYRFTVEPYTETLLSAKPLRKITRTGKVPFVGGAFIKIPGFIRGRSLPRLIAPVINALNNVFNQKSDFQYVTNIPFGFANFAEGYTKQTFEVIPGAIFPTDGDPKEQVYFPNLSRSMAWAHQDITLLFEILEKLTGAASYFMSSERQASTSATRDMIMSEKSETKFGLWVKRIQVDICEAITMWLSMYQDWAPPNLGERVLGEDGKQLIRNLSIESLRGSYDARMTPDITSGSKTLERQTQMWAFENLPAISPWVNPQINPRGNWMLTADTLRMMGKEDVERYIGPEPPQSLGKSDIVEDEWTRFMQGEEVDTVDGEDPMEHLVGHMAQKEEKYNDLDVEYRLNFDRHLFKTMLNFQKFIQQQTQEKMANTMALRMMTPQPQQQQPVRQPVQQPVAVPGEENEQGIR